MIREFQAFAVKQVVSEALVGIMYGKKYFARQVKWRIVFKQVWIYLFSASVIVFLASFALVLAWVVIGQIIDEFVKSRFTQGFFYNSSLNGMQYIFKVSGCLMLILFLVEQGYVHGLKPLMQKVKAATKL